MKKMLFVINPRSGREQIHTRLLEILDLFSGAGYQLQVHVTQGPKDATQIVREYGGEKDLVVCSGGDDGVRGSAGAGPYPGRLYE